MVIILLVITLPNLVIFPDHRIQRIHQVIVITKRIMMKGSIQKYFCIHSHCFRPVYIQDSAPLIPVVMTAVEVIQCVLNRLHDMLLSIRLRERISAIAFCSRRSCASA